MRSTPVGKRVIVDATSAPTEIVGLVADAVYFNVREAMHPAVRRPHPRRHSRATGDRPADGFGARPGHVLRLVTTRLLGVVCLGVCVGVAGGVGFGRTVRALLFQMEPTDPVALMTPIVALAARKADVTDADQLREGGQPGYGPSRPTT